MKTIYKLLGIILLSVAIFSGCKENISDTSPMSNNQGKLLKGSGPSATGQGRIAGTDRVFAFNAVTHPDGSVSGQGQLTYTHNGNGVKIHFAVDCLSVSGNEAIVSGTVTHSKAFPDYVGGPCWFKVEDSGEGSNAPPDSITFFLFCGPNDGCDTLTCDYDNEIQAGGLQPIENGNIQVRQ